MVRCKRDEKGELLLPSAGEELLPPPAGGPPPSRREVFGEVCGGRASIVERGRRVIGATAKPLYAIGGKAGGLGRRVNPVGLRKGTFPPGTGAELLPPPAGGPPPSGREVFGERERASFFVRGRRGLGATAKPLYTIDRKTEGFVGRVTLWKTIA